MPESTGIPTPASPGVCSVVVLVDGEEIATQFHVLSVTVSNELGRIPSASLRLRDGEADRQAFPVSDTDQLVPGGKIEVRLGYHGETETVFVGLIVAYGVKVRKNGCVLSLECRDEAIRMTRHRRSRVFNDVTDAEVFDDVLGEYGLDRTVAATAPRLPQVVQYQATDWDLIVSRADANGHVVAVADGVVTVGPPDIVATPVVSAQYGATVLELDAEIDARWQTGGVTTMSWDPEEQKPLTAEASEPTLPDSGNLEASELAEVIGSDPEVLRHGGAIGDPELQAWADSQLLRGRLAKVRGRVRFPGFAGVGAGDMVELNGIGEELSGAHVVSGVRQTVAKGSWETDVAFGLTPRTHLEVFPASVPPAAGLLPTASGLQTGLVTALEGDPAGEDRIQVHLALVGSGDSAVWARLATLDAGSQRGTFFRPEIGDEVVVGFLADDPRHPVVLGQLHSSAKPAPEPGSDDNHRKGVVTRSGMKLTFDDDTVVTRLETPEGNVLALSEDDASVTLADQNGSSITMDASGITIDTQGDLVLRAAGDVTLDGRDISATATAQLTAEGAAGAELSSSGTAVVKGSLVKIN